jgi:hypothetical protein
MIVPVGYGESVLIEQPAIALLADLSIAVPEKAKA